MSYQHRGHRRRPRDRSPRTAHPIRITPKSASAAAELSQSVSDESRPECVHPHTHTPRPQTSPPVGATTAPAAIILQLRRGACSARSLRASYPHAAHVSAAPSAISREHAGQRLRPRARSPTKPRSARDNAHRIRNTPRNHRMACALGISPIRPRV